MLVSRTRKRGSQLTGCGPREPYMHLEQQPPGFPTIATLLNLDYAQNYSMEQSPNVTNWWQLPQFSSLYRRKYI
jgi:hypothetical protein